MLPIVLLASNMRVIQAYNFGTRHYNHYVVSWILILMASSITHTKSSNVSMICMEKERQALLEFRRGLTDDSNLLSSWSNACESCCEWRGVTCDEQTGHVVGLNLSQASFYYCPRDEQTDMFGLRPGEEGRLSGNISFAALLDLQQLRVLDLSDNYMEGPEIPLGFGTLSNLPTLDLSWNDFPVLSLDWLSGLSSLRHLDLSGVNLSQVSNWTVYMNQLPSLEELFLSKCHLRKVTTAINYDHTGNVSESLKVIDLSFNDDLDTSVLHWVTNISTNNLVDLRLSWCNKLEGQAIPGQSSCLRGLKFLDLSSNRFTGGIPKSFRKLCTLESLFLQNNSFSDGLENLSCSKETLKNLDLSDNPFLGQFPNFTGFSSLIKLKIARANLAGTLSGNLDHLSELQSLILSGNFLNGSVPGFTGLSSLKSLDLSSNLLNGRISEGLGLLSSLEKLDLHNNSLNGVLTEKHFSNLSSLRVLNFLENSLTLNLSSDWTPPFQLVYVDISFCKVGPSFPSWLFINQRKLELLLVSHASIEDSIPDYFMNLSPSLKKIDLSFNNLYGKLPDLSSNKHISEIVLISNRLSGPLPPFPPNAGSMTLSKNMFSGIASSLCPREASKLWRLKISDNRLSGELPDCWKKFKHLLILNLENNQFSGKLPPSLGSLTEIYFLILRNNNVSGGLESLQNATSLAHLDLGDNDLSGEFPEWLGESLKHLEVLRLRSNRFNGTIPTSLCGLISIQVLDLSRNSLSGILPNCLSNMTAMVDNATKGYPFKVEEYISYGYRFTYAINVTWKGEEAVFEKNIRLVRSFDISKNKLTGEIPESITSLLKLISLNLSRNGFTGRIPSNICRLEDLEALDLSWNQLSGEIPTRVSRLHFLDHLNLSYNKLTGEIPLGPQMNTFEASSYIGNAGLFGPPLTADSPISNATNAHSDGRIHSRENDEYVTVGFYVSLVIGFVVGFWGTFGSLLFRRSWRYAYFGFWNKIADWFYVTTRLCEARVLRRFTTSANN